MTPLIAAQTFALVSAFAFAAGDTSVRFALRTSTPITGTMIQSLLTLLVFGPVALACTSPETLQGWGLVILVVAGVCSPGLASTFYYMSFRRIGLSRSSSVIGSSPLVTVIIAVIALGERPALLVSFGTVLIVAGVISLAREQRDASKEEDRKRSIWHYFIFAALATLMFGVAAVLRKTGIPLVPNLSVAMCMAALGTLLVIICWHPFLPQEYRIQIKRPSLKYFLISSICLTSAHLSFFAALQRGPLSTVAPLVYTTPLFALGFSWILIREIERLNSRVVIGVFLLCAGSALVTTSRA